MKIKTHHKVITKNSETMTDLSDNSVDLIVTSPPYPMIEMWDSLFCSINKKIKPCLQKKEGRKAFELMHRVLDTTWDEITRILKPGGIACINIGDATRKLNEKFQLYPNHSRIISSFDNANFSILPDIIWRKQSNKPNKFMGSGMLPPNAYATLEHEYILLFRKEKKRTFTPSEKKRRYNSAYFWEERNRWFSDIWFDLKGTTQKLQNKTLRERSAAYPFELPYRLITMYSTIGDTVVDPFWGTGTTTLAAMSCARNSIGYEIDNNFVKAFQTYVPAIKKITNDTNKKRIENHKTFLKKREHTHLPMKYHSTYYHFGVMTAQEKEILLYDIDEIKTKNQNEYALHHKEYRHNMQKKIDSY